MCFQNLKSESNVKIFENSSIIVLNGEIIPETKTKTSEQQSKRSKARPFAIRYWFVKPGWPTSCTIAATTADSSSRGVSFKKGDKQRYEMTTLILHYCAWCNLWKICIHGKHGWLPLDTGTSAPSERWRMLTRSETVGENLHYVSPMEFIVIRICEVSTLYL